MRKIAALLVAVMVLLGLASPAAAETADERTVRDGLWSGHWEQGEFEARLGRPVVGNQTFAPFGTWAALEDGLSDRVNGTTPSRITLGLIPVGASLATAAAGGYDSHYDTLTKTLAGATRPEIQLRLGWESNGDWYPWGYGNSATEAAQYRQAWEHFAWFAVANGVDLHTRVKLEYNVISERRTGWFPGGEGYPGNEWVDIFSLDQYCMWGQRDAAFQQAVLDDFYDVATISHALGRPAHVAFAEWSGFVDKVKDGVQVGCRFTSDPDGQRKSARFVSKMWDAALRFAHDGVRVESVPFERDPKPDGKPQEGWFAMVRPDIPASYDTGFPWSNGTRTVHDVPSAYVFRATFGADDR